jgi:hypothetical protein
MLRSEILARSLLAEAYLLENDIIAAREQSQKAVDLLESVGWRMPALRTEVVLLRHVQIIRTATGELIPAAAYLRRANAEIEAKMASVADSETRSRMAGDHVIRDVRRLAELL